jgi:hypothetical protein
MTSPQGEHAPAAIFLTNAQNVYEALAKVEREFSNRPDEIYLVGTMTESFWFVHALRVDDQGYYELSRRKVHDGVQSCHASRSDWPLNADRKCSQTYFLKHRRLQSMQTTP